MPQRNTVRSQGTAIAWLVMIGCFSSVGLIQAKLLEGGEQNSQAVHTAGFGTRGLLQSEADIDMWLAVWFNDTDAFQDAMSGNPNVNFSFGDEGACPCTALIVAAQQGNVAVVETLIERKVDLEAVTKTGNASALFAAAQSGHVAIVDALIAAGANVDKPRSGGATPLQVAAERGHLLVVLSLLAAGADQELADDTGRIPLHSSSVTIGTASTAIASTLLDNGADLEAQDNDGWTPLIWAARFGNLKNLELFLEAGADKTVKDSAGDAAKEHICRCSSEPENEGGFVCPPGGCEESSIISALEDALN